MADQIKKMTKKNTVTFPNRLIIFTRAAHEGDHRGNELSCQDDKSKKKTPPKVKAAHRKLPQVVAGDAKKPSK